MSDIKKNDNKGWSEVDLTWEIIFLPGWLPQKPLETLGFICRWSPLWTKEFNRKRKEQNQWAGLSQRGSSSHSEKRWTRVSLGPFWSNCRGGGGLLLTVSGASQDPPALLCTSFSHCHFGPVSCSSEDGGASSNGGSAKSGTMHLETLRKSKEGFFWGLAARHHSWKPVLKLYFLPAYKCTCA